MEFIMTMWISVIRDSNKISIIIKYINKIYQITLKINFTKILNKTTLDKKTTILWTNDY